METPSSMSRITRSQANAEPRSALLDITNDSPIVGLAAAGLPEKARIVPAKSAGTPGSGEALLRGQVRTLLQKVEEEEQGEAVVLTRTSSSGDRPLFRVLLDLPGPSPVQLLLAPTPANTPQIAAGLSASTDGTVVEDCVKIDAPQAGLKEKEEPLDAPAPECQINRALLFDSPGKSEASAISSSLTYQDSEISSEEKSPDDDSSSSAWSLEVNMSGHHDDGDEEEEEEEEFEEEEYEEDEESFDELCEGISKMSMGNEKVVGGLPVFTGMHTRFVYSKDDEVIEEEEIVKERVSPSAVVLKGLPVPKGKHMRFHDEEEEEEE